MQVAPAASVIGSVLPQLPPKRANAPEAAVSAVTSRATVPSLPKVTVCAALVVPTFWSPKLMAVGVIVRLPEPATVGVPSTFITMCMFGKPIAERLVGEATPQPAAWM